MTEKLTDDQRWRLTSSNTGMRALRIIDSQAAALERVRHLAEEYEGDNLAVVYAILAALSAAPEHTGPDCGHVGDKRDGHCFGCAVEAECAAANARVAELETACAEYRGLLAAAENAESAAASRLSTATELLVRLKRGPTWAQHRVLIEDVDAFLSTAPAPTERAEWKWKAETAVALLNEWRFHDPKKCQADLCWRTDEFVASAPAPTEREKAERAVLEAIPAFPLAALKRWQYRQGGSGAFARAALELRVELARRAVKLDGQ